MKSKKCKFKNKINAYIDHELSEEETIILENHLSSCDECKKTYTELTELNSLLLNYKEIEPSIYAINSIFTKIDKEPASKFRLRRRFTKLAIATSVAASFFVGLWLSTLTFRTYSSNMSDYQLGENSLYSYVIGDQDVQ